MSAIDHIKAPRALVILQVRPRGAGPPFWGNQPAVIAQPIEFEWATIMADVAIKLSKKRTREVLVHLNGTTVAPLNTETFASYAIEWQHVGEVIDAWFDNDPESPFTWEFRLLPTGRYAE